MGKRRRKTAEEREEQDEPDFERAPRRLTTPGKDERDLLPVKQKDGKWKRQRTKHTDATRQKGDDNEAEEVAEEVVAVDPEVERLAELERLAKKVEEDARTVASKKVAVAKLGRQIIEAPEKHIGLLRELLDMARRDRSPVVQRLALLSCVSALIDVIPSYRIRPPTEKELSMQITKEQEQLRCAQGSNPDPKLSLSRILIPILVTPPRHPTQHHTTSHNRIRCNAMQRDLSQRSATHLSAARCISAQRGASQRSASQRNAVQRAAQLLTIRSDVNQPVPC